MGGPVRDVQERRIEPTLSDAERAQGRPSQSLRTITPLAASVAAVAVAIDHATKWWALNELADRDIDLIGSLRFNLVHNDGGAFGIGGRFGNVFGIAAIVAVLLIVRTGGSFGSRWSQAGIGLVLAGALGNLLDRVFRAGDGFLGGDVVDFIDPQWWPVFNVADICLYVGAGLLIVTAGRDTGDQRAA